MAVGINPNLPGFWQVSHNAINPMFQDLLQYAHYFRYRAVDKLQIPDKKYEQLLKGREDGPKVRRPLTDYWY
jgi:hypothetical protein